MPSLHAALLPLPLPLPSPCPLPAPAPPAVRLKRPPCSKPQGHGTCAETFYKATLVEELQQKKADPEDRQRMLDMLRRLEEEAPDVDGDDEDGDDGDDDDDVNALRTRLSEADLGTPPTAGERMGTWTFTLTMPPRSPCPCSPLWCRGARCGSHLGAADAQGAHRV